MDGPSAKSSKRAWDDAPGVIGVTASELPPLPDDILSRPESGRTDPRRWFKEPARPLHIEIGTGKGTFLVEQAPRSPEINHLGIEWEREYYLYTADRLRRRGLTNVRMLHANAVDFLRWRVPDGVVETIHLYYSDPWPKAKHHKNRVVQHGFLADAWRVLVPDGTLRIVTDHDELWSWCLGHLTHWTADALPTDGLAPRATTPPVGSTMIEGRSTERASAFRVEAFVPPDWVRDGGIVGTNYERKFTDGSHRPHAVVLRKRFGDGSDPAL